MLVHIFSMSQSSFRVFLSDAHSDHASSVFIKSARLLFHNKLTLFCTQCYVCLQFTQDLFVNKAIP